MSQLLHLSSAPHDRGSLSTKTVMRDVLVALLPTAVLGVWAHGWYAGFVMLVSIAAAVVTEYLFNLATKRGNTLGDASAVVTGLLLALTLPAEVPVYVPVLGSVFAILVVKCLFGGLGHNIMNPALAGRAFLLISFGHDRLHPGWRVRCNAPVGDCLRQHR
jgi:electron transport complex protein RnfD